MSNGYNYSSTDFKSLHTASHKLFESICQYLNVNSAYVARKGKDAMIVISSYNAKDVMVQEGFSIDYGDSNCQHVLSSTYHSTSNLLSDEQTKNLKFNMDEQVKGFLGVTLMDTNGKTFGTLCVLDKEEKTFSDEDVEFLKSMADVLSHLIELDETKYNMAFLNVPIVPITEGVSILTLQGIIDENRADKILRTVLEYGSKHKIDYFIVDLSGLVILDGQFPQVIVKLVQSLEMMGITTIMTGISPASAMHDGTNTQLTQLNTKTVFNLEAALHYIGFSLIES
ncbi:anti-sigma factor antagonist [Pontibacillus halophilus JSM 076056 = DSM 19796]|uniref:Anti-sigma factor antagonist n=1 Tax=Pontibacillus halophilus JSM 076056 = DSM 19796 TaxID=1385510 RepID=A0A0A5I5H4_9BACI|nr:GAF domain-containing protein [Pontibacillus halophilus]KGX91072.1 anti-sigma factor antagonist [Pontibacillus halophilus JSM 076056 = DSM 19796]